MAFAASCGQQITDLNEKDRLQSGINTIHVLRQALTPRSYLLSLFPHYFLWHTRLTFLYY